MQKEVDDFWTFHPKRLEAVLKGLQEHGVTKKHLTRLYSDPEYIKRVARFLTDGNIDFFISQKKARAIMGENFWGPEEWFAKYGVKFTKEQIDQIENFPWDENILNSRCQFCGELVKDCHFAFLGINQINDEDLTILKWRKIYSESERPKFYSYENDVWYANEKFATTTTMPFKWHLLHKNKVPQSNDKTFRGQSEMLGTYYEVPNAITEVTKNILLFHKTKGVANESRYTRARDITNNGGGRIIVSGCNLSGIRIFFYSGDYYSPDFYIAASRK